MRRWDEEEDEDLELMRRWDEDLDLMRRWDEDLDLIKRKMKIWI